MSRWKAFFSVLVFLLCQLEVSKEETNVLPSTWSSSVNNTDATIAATILNTPQGEVTELNDTTTTLPEQMNNTGITETASESNTSNVQREGNTSRICWNSTEGLSVPGNDTSTRCDDSVSETTTTNIFYDDVGSKSSIKVDYVGYIVVPTFFLMAIFGNSLTIRVMLSKTFRTKTISIILIALSVSDSIFSCIIPFNKKFTRNLLGFDIRALSSIGCSIFFVIHKTSKMSSSWFVLFISFERFMAICFPLKTKFICTKKNTYIGIACVYFGLLIVNGIWDFSTKIVNGICIPNYATPEIATLAKVYLVVGTFIYSLLPATIMLVLTPLTVVTLARHSKLRKVLSHNDSIADKTVKMTTMLIGVTIAFLVLVTPISIAHNVSFALGENIFETNHTGMMIAREILQTMEQLNYSVHFLLYVMCSRDFRKKVAVILRLNCFKRRKDLAKSKGSSNIAATTSG